MFGCLVFVFAALIEYAVLIKIRYGNASAGIVKERVMRKKRREVTLLHMCVINFMMLHASVKVYMYDTCMRSRK